MHCNICDKNLTEKEIVYNKELGTFEPCTECLDVAMDAAYSDGFTTEDDEYVLLDEDDSSDPRNLAQMSFWKGVRDED